LSKNWSARAVLSAQNSSDVLIAGEKFGLGGGLGDIGPRGFLEREVTVDKGFKLSLEAGRRFANGKYRVGAFVDYGSGEQNNVQVGEVEDQSLSSIGLTFNWNIRPDLSLSADFGYVLSGVETADGQSLGGSDNGDNRFHLSMRYFPKWPFGSSSGGLK